jgi:hypothetical protein
MVVNLSFVECITAKSTRVDRKKAQDPNGLKKVASAVQEHWVIGNSFHYVECFAHFGVAYRSVRERLSVLNGKTAMAANKPLTLAQKIPIVRDQLMKELPCPRSSTNTKLTPRAFRTWPANGRCRKYSRNFGIKNGRVSVADELEP